MNQLIEALKALNLDRNIVGLHCYNSPCHGPEWEVQVNDASLLDGLDVKSRTDAKGNTHYLAQFHGVNLAYCSVVQEKEAAA